MAGPLSKSTEIKTIAPVVSLGFFSYIKNIAMLMRVAHWAKNLFLFLPIFFAGEVFDLTKILHTSLGFIAFCLTASCIYIFNDYKDLEKDRLHPVKRERALASGKVSVPMAFSLMLFCLLAGLAVGWFCDIRFMAILVAYLILNVAYSFGLKNISIVDIMIIAIGFILRIKGGGILAEVAISQYLVVMVFLLSLFLALAKRRDDVLIRQSSGGQVRSSLSGYNLEFLNMSIAIVSAIIIVVYLMYTLSPDVIRRLGTYRLYYTTIFVVAGLMRYMQIIYIKADTRSPARILYKDHFIQICLVLWALSFYFLIYFPNLHLYE